MNKQWMVDTFDHENGDLNELLGMFAEEYGPVDPSKPEYFEWYCRDNPAGRAVIPIARDPETGKLVGQFWMIPLRAKYPDGEYVGAVGMNALVARHYRRQGIILNLARASYEGLAAQGINFSTIFPNRRLKKTRYAFQEWKNSGPLNLWALPLDVALFDRTRLRKNPFLLNLAKITARLAIPILFREKRPKSHGNIKLVEKPSFDQQFDLFWENIKDKYPILFVRDAAFLRWRYAENPCRDYVALAAMDGDDMIGYLILRSGKIRKFPVGAVVDMLVEPSGRGEQASRLLVNEALAHFRRDGMYLAVCVMRGDTQEERALKYNGFRSLRGALSPQQVEVYIKTFTDALPKEQIFDVNNWFITLGDFDIV